MNAIRFIVFTFRGFRYLKHRHQRGWLQRNAVTLLAGFGGATVLGMPLWMILLGLI